MLRANLVHLGNDPLRIVAFFFNKLKKAQVLDTDISSRVDKILQDEVNVVSYGVLGYLLLGVVRIYSKKVEYVLKDCEMLIKINKFDINIEDIACVETIRMSVTIPAKLELDAFELDVPEDDIEGHIAATEEITLKEVEPRIERFGLLSHEKFEEFDIDESTSSYDDHVMQNIRLSQLLMDMDMDMDIETFLQDSSLDVTPQPKFQVDSFGTPKRGVVTSDLKLISTPTMREHPQFSKRKKIVLDHKRLVLSNEVLKENIRNASDLVSNRRKSHRTVHTMQRESLIASLPNRFYEPLHPCSSKLQLLFSKKEMKIPNSLQIVETLGKLDLSESQIIGSLQPIASILPTSSHCPNVSGSQAFGILQHVAPSSTNESIEIEQSSERNEVLSLTDEEINSSATENSELCGWSGCTRKVASYLHQSFLHPKEQREQDVVNFSQVFGGKTPKESARLFYEILVLKSTGFVDVEQKEAYGDIAISKLPKLDQSF